MRRIFVHGDREAKGIEVQVRALGDLCHDRGIGINVGESGETVNILASSNADVRVHHSKDGEAPNVPFGSVVKVVDCVTPAAMATQHLLHFDDVVADPNRVGWGVRLAVLEQMSDGFIFFPGRERTLAHLVPILAFIAKGERDKGKPCRRVALVGWHTLDLDAILCLFQMRPALPLVVGVDVTMGFIGVFGLGSVAEALDWVAEGFPAKETR
ncbi:MAG: hypothetical protein Q7S89_02120 [bacterium]|nr:hypothetical protein [bacterium]